MAPAPAPSPSPSPSPAPSPDSRPRRLAHRLALATGGGSSEETRAFLQKRVALFIGITAALWAAVGVTSVVSAALFWPAIFKMPGGGLTASVHYGATALLFVMFWWCRRGKKSLTSLGRWEVGTAFGQALVMSLIMHATDMRYRPDLNMTLGLSCTLIARAAVLPSTGERTFLVGLVSVLPILIATYLTHAGIAPSVRLMPPAIATSQIATWAGFVLLLTAMISRVIYGLRQEVRAAARLGQYTLERKIGEGGMGVVYLARHALLRRPTAVKLLAAGQQDRKALARFEREVQTTSALRHPNTVAIYDYGHTPEGVFYYAMEYLDGVDLDQLLASDGPQPEGRVIHILSQIAGALDEAHGVGLIHRDIKPSNVLLCDQGHQADFAKVLDFGLVYDTGDASRSSSTHALTGTPLYLSPEAILAPDTLDPRSDLYALGALAYALLTGAPPFEGTTVLEVCARHLHAEVVPPSVKRPGAVSPNLEALILACLAKDREQRPASAAALRERLSGCAVTPWTQSDARRWWDTQGRALKERRQDSRPGSGLSQTIAVDLIAR